MTIYYNPENYGLQVVAVVEKEPEYDFDMVVVWKQLSTGKFFWMNDSGCSCPSPFEEYNSVEDLNQLDYDELKEFLDRWPDYHPDSVPEIDKVEFLRKVFFTLHPKIFIDDVHKSLDKILGE